MARIPRDQELQPSLLDCLIDYDPDTNSEKNYSSRRKLHELQGSIKQDLENLLNSRVRCEGWPHDLQDLERSLVNYGLPDFISMNLATQENRKRFARVLEESIRRWEPRLDRIKVGLVDNADDLDRTLHFRIEALLLIEPTPEPIVFDSTLESQSCNFTVRRGDNG